MLRGACKALAYVDIAGNSVFLMLEHSKNLFFIPFVAVLK